MGTLTSACVVLGEEAEQQLHPPHVALTAVVLVLEQAHRALDAAAQQAAGVQGLRLFRESPFGVSLFLGGKTPLGARGVSGATGQSSCGASTTVHLSSASQGRPVWPRAHGSHVAPDGFEHSPTQNRKLS